MDAGDGFLYRKEQKVQARALKRGEELTVRCPVEHDGRTGLLGISKTRIHFTAKKGLGMKTWSWHRGDVKSLKVEKKRYGTLHLLLKNGKRLAFVHKGRGHAQACLEELRPPRRGPAPTPARAAIGSKAPRHAKPLQRSTAGSEPRADRRAKVEDLYRQGILTKKEYEWQLQSL